MMLRRALLNTRIARNHTVRFMAASQAPHGGKIMDSIVTDEAEKAVDKVLDKLTKGDITRSDARTEIMGLNVNLGLIGIDEYNVDEVIYEAASNA